MCKCGHVLNVFGILIVELLQNVQDLTDALFGLTPFNFSNIYPLTNRASCAYCTCTFPHDEQNYKSKKSISLNNLC